MSALAERAMLVSLTLSAWTARKLDRTLIQPFLKELGADERAGAMELRLVPEEAIEPTRQVRAAARERYKRLTLPWGNENLRILSMDAFWDFQTAMAEERARVEAVDEAFVRCYPDLYADAERRLGPVLFRVAQLPRVEEIRGRFGFTLNILPVSDANDFRVGLDAATVEHLRAEIRSELTQRYQDAQQDLWTRLVDALRHFVAMAGDTKRKLYPSVLENLRDIARIAPSLTLEPNPSFNTLCQTVEDLTANLTTQQLRNSKALRTASAAEAKAVLTQLDSALAAWRTAR